MNTLPLAICALVLSAPLAMAQTADTTMDHSKMDHSSMSMTDAKMKAAVHAKAKVHSIGEGTVNVTHEPIPAIGWPAMTMDMALTPDADIDGISAGDAVVLMLIKGDDGMYAVRTMMLE